MTILRRIKLFVLIPLGILMELLILACVTYIAMIAYQRRCWVPALFGLVVGVVVANQIRHISLSWMTAVKN